MHDMVNIGSIAIEPINSRSKNIFNITHDQDKIGSIKTNKKECQIKRLTIDEEFVEKMGEIQDILESKHFNKCEDVKSLCFGNDECKRFEALGFEKILTSGNKSFSIMIKNL
jgi:hypothetical protein